MVPGFSSGNAHVDFKVVDGSLYNGSDFVKEYPFFRVPLDAGEYTEIHVFISINSAPFFGSATGVFTVTDILPFDHIHLSRSEHPFS